MKKSDLGSRVAPEASLSNAAADSAVNAIFSATSDALANGEKASIVGFGMFSTQNRADCQGWNPRTDKSIAIAASTVPSFNARNGLRDAVSEWEVGSRRSRYRDGLSRALGKGSIDKDNVTSPSARDLRGGLGPHIARTCMREIAEKLCTAQRLWRQRGAAMGEFARRRGDRRTRRECRGRVTGPQGVDRSAMEGPCRDRTVVGSGNRSRRLLSWSNTGVI